MPAKHLMQSMQVLWIACNSALNWRRPSDSTGAAEVWRLASCTVKTSTTARSKRELP